MCYKLLTESFKVREYRKGVCGEEGGFASSSIFSIEELSQQRNSSLQSASTQGDSFVWLLELISLPANTVVPSTLADAIARANGWFANWNTKPDESGTWFYWPAAGASFQVALESPAQKGELSPR